MLYYFKNGESSYPLGAVFLNGADLEASDSMTLRLKAQVSLTCTDTYMEMNRDRVFQLTCKSTMSFAEWQRDLSREIESVAEQKVITRSGWLEKRGHVNTDWSKRWFVCVADRLLLYFPSEKDNRASGMLSLERVCSAQDISESDRQHPFMLMAGDRELICNAASSALQIAWLEFFVAKCHLTADGSERRQAVERELDEEAKKELQRTTRMSEKLKKVKKKVLNRVSTRDSATTSQVDSTFDEEEGGEESGEEL